MSFGFAIGDVIAAGELIRKLVKCLNQSTGSAAEYNQLIHELTALNSALDAVDKACRRRPGIGLEALKHTANTSSIVLADFLAKVEKYEGSLGETPTSSKLKIVAHKIVWTTKAEDIARLRACLNSYYNVISVQMWVQCIDANDLDEEARVKQQTATHAFQERVERWTALATENAGVQQSMIRSSHTKLVDLFNMISGEVISSLHKIVETTQKTL